MRIALCLMLLSSASVRGQQNVRKINHYAHEATLQADKNKVSVTIDGLPPKTFALIRVNGEAQLKNDQERTLFFDLLQLNTQQKISLSEQYKVELKALDSKLIARAIELNGLKLVNNPAVSATSPTDSHAAPESAPGSLPEVLTSTATQTSETQSTQNYLWLTAAMVIGGLLGFMLGNLFRKSRSSGKNTLPDRDEPETTNLPASSDAALKTTRDRQVLYARLQKEFEKLSDEFEDRKYFDRQYFTAIDKNIIAPFWEAVHNKNEQRAVELALKSVAQLTAVTRLRLDIEQSFDQHNLDDIINKRNVAPQKQIDRHTNKDDIPDHIGTILSILKQYHLSGLGNTNFQGYIMNNLDA